MNIRPMQFTDLSFAAACTAAEGWASETRAEFEGFFTHDPNGCFIAEVEGKRAGIAVATPYGDTGFVGEIIVLPEMRGQGLGRQLLDRCVAYLQGRGAQTIYLDGMPRAAPLYERAGFCKTCRSLRFTGSLPGRPHPRVRAMRPAHLGAVCALDRAAFGADRSFFLKRRHFLCPESCKILEENGEIVGYIAGRRGHGLISAGPWVVQEGVENPGDLLESFATEADGATIAVGVLETNPEAVAILTALGFTQRPDPPWRMALGPSGELGVSGQCYAVGSAAKG